MNKNLMEFFQEIVFQRNVKDRAYVINLDEYKDVATHWIALFCKKKTKLFISIVLVFNIFLKKLKCLLRIRI